MDPMEMLRRLSGAEDDTEPKRPEADVIADLKEAFRRYSSPNPYGPGDLVTPKKHAPLRDAGEPHVVLEVRESPSCDFDQGEPGSNIYGRRVDMRVACNARGHITAFWVESWHFERWRAN